MNNDEHTIIFSIKPLATIDTCLFRLDFKLFFNASSGSICRSACDVCKHSKSVSRQAEDQNRKHPYLEELCFLVLPIIEDQIISSGFKLRHHNNSQGTEVTEHCWKQKLISLVLKNWVKQ